MRQRGDRASLPLEAGLALRISNGDLGQDLENDVTAQRRVARAIDLAHAANRDEGNHFVHADTDSGVNCMREAAAHRALAAACGTSGRSVRPPDARCLTMSRAPRCPVKNVHTH